MITHQDVATRDLSEADDALRTVYGASRMTIQRAPEHFRYRHRFDSDGELSLLRMKVGEVVRMSGDDLGSVAICQAREGRLRGGPTQPIQAFYRPMMASAQQPFETELELVDMLCVNLDVDRFQRIAMQSLDRTSPVPLDGGIPVSEASERYWRTLVHHVYTTILSNTDAWNSELIRVDMFRSLVVAAIECFGLARGETPDPDESLPSAVLRAQLFIDENAAFPITVDDVAQAARMSTRGLQWAFRRHVDTTPTEYLRRARLAGAHASLAAADAGQGDTVEAIAARWGFAHPGRFAQHYQAEYGELPSATLRS